MRQKSPRGTGPGWMATLIALAPCWCGATTWSEESVPDPIVEGATCSSSMPMSYGSYIYQWPEKYDQVFWPLTDRNAITVCPKSGFVSYFGDLELTAAEKERIAAALARLPTRLDGAREVLARLEAVYDLRDTKVAFDIRLLRTLAYLHEDSLEDQVAARGYRERALAAIRKELAGELEPITRLEYLFVVAAYEREFGNVDQAMVAEKELDALLDEIPPPADDGEDDADADDEDADDADASGEEVDDDESAEALSGYADYLRELRKDLPRIAPGGVLAPPVAHDEDPQPDEGG